MHARKRIKKESEIEEVDSDSKNTKKYKSSESEFSPRSTIRQKNRRRQQGVDSSSLLSGSKKIGNDTSTDKASRTQQRNNNAQNGGKIEKSSGLLQPMRIGVGKHGSIPDQLLNEFVESELKKRRQTADSTLSLTSEPPSASQPPLARDSTAEGWSDQHSLAAHGKLLEVSLPPQSKSRASKQVLRNTQAPSAGDANNIENRLRSVIAESSVSSSFLRPAFERPRELTMADIERQLADEEEIRRIYEQDSKTRAQASRAAKEKWEQQQRARTAAAAAGKKV
ncbi:uncharacterized protein V2V93DRAFT_358391 [Kockiozyma suomiensis]|uniref:uncharacterized protein n=1 Tax=Kockiozyma suomiensis TaxID=1337062 RepID=UPI003343E27D